MTAFVVTVIPFLTSLALTVLLVLLAPRLGLVDQPAERKVHTRPTPRGGGLAIFAGTCLAYLCLWSTGWNAATVPWHLVSYEAIIFVGLGLLVVLLGLLDDLFNLPWQFRLSVQAALAAGAVIWIVPYPPRPDRPVLGTHYPLLSGILAVLWIVALINAFNMLDNMDGLSAGVAWIAAAAFAVLLWDPPPKAFQAHLSYLMLIGALTGFLYFNRPPARIFMGDAGSTFLGFFFGVRSLSDGIINPDMPQTWLAPVCILAVPLYDQATVVALRLWQGRSPFHADKQHLSHRLVALGLSQPAAVGVIYLLGLASAGAGLTLPQVSEGTAWLVVAALVLGWLAVAVVEYVPYLRK